jgi:Fe-S-cluster containining protein
MEECSCRQCISACFRDPGRLVPGDLPKLSRLLQMSEGELAKSCLVKVPVASNGRVALALAPAKRKGRRFVTPPGAVASDSYAEEAGRCLFLDEEDRCAVHAAKPFECAAYMGCRNTFLGKPYRARTVEEFFYKRWKGAGSTATDAENSLMEPATSRGPTCL